MIPPKISADILSLKENEERLAVSVFFYMNEDGFIDYDNIEYVTSIIKSKLKLTYTKADDLIFQEDIISF
jgi:exoribonuclease R